MGCVVRSLECTPFSCCNCVDYIVFFFLGRVNCTVMNRLQIVISVLQDRTFLESVAGGVECKLDSKRFFLTASVSFA